MDGCSLHMCDGGRIDCDGDMGIGYGLVRKSAEVVRKSSSRLLCCTFSPPTIQSSYVAIAMYLTSYVMLLRRPAIAPAEWVGGELRWYVACMCDPVLIST